MAWEFPDAGDGAGVAAPEGFGSGFGAGFFFFLASALWAFADCAEDCVAEALSESALFGSDCADADVAQAIIVTKAKAVVHIFFGNKLPMPGGGRALMCSWTLTVFLQLEPVSSLRRGLALLH